MAFRPALLDLPATRGTQGVSPRRVISLRCSGGLLRGSRSVGWEGGLGGSWVIGQRCSEPSQ